MIFKVFNKNCLSFLFKLEFRTTITIWIFSKRQKPMKNGKLNFCMNMNTKEKKMIYGTDEIYDYILQNLLINIRSIRLIWLDN